MAKELFIRVFSPGGQAVKRNFAERGRIWWKRSFHMRDDFHPLVRGWFDSNFVGATEPQILGWPAIRAGQDVLISAPTGSGKTLAAFTLC